MHMASVPLARWPIAKVWWACTGIYDEASLSYSSNSLINVCTWLHVPALLADKCNNNITIHTFLGFL